MKLNDFDSETSKINPDFLRMTASIEDFSVYDWLTDRDVQNIIRELLQLKIPSLITASQAHLP